MMLILSLLHRFPVQTSGIYPRNIKIKTIRNPLSGSILKATQEGCQIDINAFDTKFFSQAMPGHIDTSW